MPGERRNLRSSKETSSSTNGEEPRASSQSSSSNKDKPVPTRATSSKGKALPTKKTPGKEPAEDKPHTNGTEPVGKGINGTEDIDMVDNGPENLKIGTNNEGEDEMTVVVPPPNSSKLSGEPSNEEQGDVAMENTDMSDNVNAELDPKDKAVAGKRLGVTKVALETSHHIYWQLANCIISDIKANFTLLERAVAQFDARFILRVLRSISSIRTPLSQDLLAQVITETYSSTNPVARTLLAALGKEDASFEKPDALSEMDIDTHAKDKPQATGKPTTTPKDVLPEVDTYLSILVQIHLYDTKATEFGAKFSSNLVEKLRTLNRRTLDALSARVYYYYSLFFEQLAPLPPSPMASVVSIRPQLLAALRTSVLRKDQDTRATIITPINISHNSS